MPTRVQKQTISLLQLIGTVKNSLDMTVTVLIQDKNEKVLLCTCADASISSVDGDAGYAVGCLMIGTTSGTLWINKGSTTVADFDLMAAAE